MTARTLLSRLFICLAASGLAGCHRQIVRATPPSVAAAPPPAEPEPPLPLDIETPLTLTTTRSTLSLQPPPPPPEVSPPPAPAPPRPPATAEAVRPREPEALQISPQLSAARLAVTQRRTTDDIRVAERNLQLAYGKELNASQEDLLGKVRGFLAQAREAIRASDWIRANNLAQKAEILSAELLRSL